MIERTVEFSRDTLVRYAGASGDFNPIHYRDDVAASVGLPGVLAQCHAQHGFGLFVVDFAFDHLLDVPRFDDAILANGVQRLRIAGEDDLLHRPFMGEHRTPQLSAGRCRFVYANTLIDAARDEILAVGALPVIRENRFDGPDATKVAGIISMDEVEKSTSADTGMEFEGFGGEDKREAAVGLHEQRDLGFEAGECSFCDGSFGHRFLRFGFDGRGWSSETSEEAMGTMLASMPALAAKATLPRVFMRGWRAEVLRVCTLLLEGQAAPSHTVLPEGPAAVDVLPPFAGG